MRKLCNRKGLLAASTLFIGLAAGSSFAGQVSVNFEDADDSYKDVEWYAPNISTEAMSLRDFQESEFNEINLDPEQDILRKQFDNNPINDVQKAIAIRQLSDGGLSAIALLPSYMNSIELQALKEKDLEEITRQELVWNSMNFEIDRKEKSAYFDIVAKKIIYFGTVPVDILYRWEMVVRPGGLIVDFIPDPRKADGTPMPGFHYKYHARAPFIEVRNFEINGYPVPYYDDRTGVVIKLGDVQHPSPSDCLDIDSKVSLSGSGAIEINASDIRFCAGSCSGYMITATNN